ncbi:MAG: hypothetical protein KGJ40_07135 [candidate division NC10 bacterium]|nr:hypothetical protein [candidate division NC10 bacterium]
MKYWIAFLLMILGLGPPASATAQAVREVRVRWDAYIGAPAPQVAPGTEQPSNLFTLLERRRVPGLLPRQRNLELSSEQIVVVTVDAQGLEIGRQLIPDSRVLRSEGPGPTGELSGVVLHYAKIELLITLPDDPAIAELRLYHPRWTGTAFVLDLLGIIPLPEGS